MAPRRLIVIATVLLVVGLPLAAAAQRGGGFGRWFGRGWVMPNAEYDGRFILARVRYLSGGSWRADYPDMERNLTEMLQELTSIRANVTETNVYTLDDPDLLKYPVIYLTEPGYWYPTPEEAQGLRNFIDKGGFIIFDDFHFPNEWAVFEYGLRQAWPEAKIVPLERDHPIFNSFFRIDTLRVPYPGWLGEQGLYGEFYGIYQDNDPSKRLAAVINYNMDLGDYVEWAQSGRAYAFEPTNEAYKFMINYVIYGLSR
ncbi:MAG: DUF4159 domain-containing protein [Acidobacteriota bacterium]|nr:MAG: hypothetical protein DIU54_10160 [Acidobacteriota bacterium]